MKIAFVLFASDAELRKYFSVNGLALVPKEIREKYGVHYKFFSYPQQNSEIEYLASLIKANPEFAFIGLSEGPLAAISSLGVPLSILDVSDRRMATEFAKLTTFWTKRLNAVAQLFSPLGNRKALLLPLKNFEDVKVKNAWNELIANYGERTYQFIVELESLLKHLRTREMPKKRGMGKDKYFVDDRGCHYSYGHELHAHQEVEGGNHTIDCFVSAKLRLGIPYANERHFNVSLDGNASLNSWQFENCHGAQFNAPQCQHLNVFPNDFIA